LKPLGMRTVSSYLRENADRYDITYNNHIERDGQHRRGFKGIGILDQAKQERVGSFKIVKN